MFKKFKNILLIDLDTSIFNLAQEKLSVLFEKTDTPKAEVVHNVFRYQAEKEKPNPPLLCDPLAVVALFRPKCITSGMNVNIRVELKGHRTRGCTVIDYFGENKDKPNAYLVKNFDLGILREEVLKSYE